MAVAEPLAGTGCASSREYTVRTSQPFPQSGLSQFGAWLCTVGWQEELDCGLDLTQMALRAENILRDKGAKIFPTKSVRVSNNDKPFITAELKKLDNYVKKEYKKGEKSKKYVQLKQGYDCKFKKAASDYLNGCVADMMQEAPGKAYRAMKKLGARPGDMDEEAGFSLTEHVDRGLTAQQSAEASLISSLGSATNTRH